MKINRWNWKPRNDRAAEAGQSIVLVTLILGIFLLGALCFAFDLSNMWFHRQSAQSAADAACAAGAMDILVDAEGGATGKQGFTLGTNYSCTTSSTDSICKYAAANGYDAGTSNSVNVCFPSITTPTAACGPPAGVTAPPVGIAGTYPWVRVDIVDHVPTLFAGLLSGGTSKDVHTFSTCGVELATAPIPLVVLDPRAADSKTLNVGGTATLAIYGGPQQSVEVDSPNSNSANLQGLVDLSQGGPATPPTGSDFGTWGGPTTEPSVPNPFNPGTTGHWLAPSAPVKDPFEQVQAPAQPTYVPPAPAYSLAPGTGECPNIAAISGCDVYEPGYYPAGISVKGAGGSNLTLSLFQPGIYYVKGGFSAASNSCIRPSVEVGDGSGGTMFYFADTNSINVGSNSGTKCSDNKTPPNPIVPAFNTTSGTGSLTYGAKCTAASSIPANMPTTLTGTVLLGPCQKPTGVNVPTYCDPNCNLNYGDPLGVTGPLGEQRGFLFFQNRAQNAGTNPNWQGGGQFLLAGTMYFHQCVTTGSDTGLSCSTASAFNDQLTLAGNPGSSTYILGQIIVDQLTLTGTATLTMDLNSETSYNILKASILQ